MPNGTGALSHLRVLDLTVFLSGPYATQLLGDLGAEIIKVEPIDGDQTRNLPPNFVGDDSVYYHSLNRNKRSLAVNLRTSEGQEIVRKLAAKADVLIENNRPGGMAKYGLGYEELCAINPRLIYSSISGFGQDGPDANLPAYDMVVQAISGGMSLTGEPDGRPVRAGIPIGDIGAALHAVIGILAALEARHTTGKGQYIDVAMLDVQVAMLCYQAAYYLASKDVPAPQGRGHASIPTYRSFTGGDGRDFVICANTDRMWRSLCEVVGRDDLANDPRMSTRPKRYEHRFEIWQALEAAFAQKPAADWVALLRKAAVPVGEVNTLDRALSNPQIRHRNMVLDITGEDGLHVEVAGNPIKMPDYPERDHDFPPRLGADTKDVLSRELSLSDAEIEALVAAGAIASAR